MNIEVHFTEEDWARVEEDWTAWWSGEMERPLVMIEGFVPSPGLEISNILDLGPPATAFPLERTADEILDYYEARLEAKRFYGDASAYPRIFKANREVIKDPDLIFPGQKIRIPASDA